MVDNRLIDRLQRHVVELTQDRDPNEIPRARSRSAPGGSLALPVVGVSIGLLAFHGIAVSQPSPLPEAAELVAKHSRLALGRFDSAAHRTQYTRQHTEQLPGMIVSVELFQRRPNELVQRISTTEGPGGLCGYNGSLAWKYHDGVARILTGTEADALRSMATFYHSGVLGEQTQPRKLAPGEHTVGETQFAGEATFAVSLLPTLAAALDAGLPVMYFSKATGLYLGMTLGGERQSYFIRITLRNYKDFGGLLVATSLTMFSRTGATEFEHSVTIDDIQWDALPDSAFQLPEPVRALVKP